jgi:hypothetical protein
MPQTPQRNVRAEDDVWDPVQDKCARLQQYALAHSGIVLSASWLAVREWKLFASETDEESIARLGLAGKTGG